LQFQLTGSFTSAGTIPWNLPLDDPRTNPGECSINWELLMNELVQQRVFDGNRADVVYYALLPAGIPLNVPGCGRPGLSAAVAGDQGTLMHEIGHAYGFRHTLAACPNGLSAGPTDPRYPAYAPHPSGSIGEYGLDISNGRVFSPQTTFDYMSYCLPQWMSLYQHDRLWLHTRLNPSHVGAEENPIDIPYEEPVIPDFDHPSPPEYKRKRSVDMEATPIISITGVVRSSEEVEVNTVARVMAVASPLGTRTRLTAQLVGDAGEPVARGQLFRLDSHAGCGCGTEGGDPGAPPYSFQAIVPDVEPGTALRIVEDEREIWSRRAPEVEHLEVGVTEDQQLELHWHAQTAGEEPEAWAQWSADRGESWQVLVGNLTGDAATVGLAGLPDGEILVRVLVLDGFFTSTSEPVRVEIPARPPEAAILHPAEGQWLYSNRTLHLWAEATDPAGEPLPDWVVPLDTRRPRGRPRKASLAHNPGGRRAPGHTGGPGVRA
jgi:hypothetical protein